MTGVVHIMQASEESANGSANNNGFNGSAYSASSMQPSSFTQ